MIDKIIELSGGVKIDFEDDGTCYIAHMDQDKIDKAIELIKEIAEDLPLNTVIE
jgi:polyribonucleotide nucleotidyltransferase